MNSGSFDIFKGSAAAKVSLIPPTANAKDWMESSGAVLIEAAKVIGTDGQNKKYDWSKGNKISFALGIADICNLLENPETNKLVHEYQDETKSLSFKESVDERYAGSWMMSLRVKSQDGTSRNLTVPMTGGEFAALGILIRAALPKMLAW